MDFKAINALKGVSAVARLVKKSKKNFCIKIISIFAVRGVYRKEPPVPFLSLGIINIFYYLCCMKSFIGCLIFALLPLFVAREPIDRDSCTCKGIPLYGRVKIVTEHPNFRIQVTDDYPDIVVKIVYENSHNCCEWQIVEEYPDFTVQFVNDYPDFTVSFDDNSQGIR